MCSFHTGSEGLFKVVPEGMYQFEQNTEQEILHTVRNYIKFQLDSTGFELKGV